MSPRCIFALVRNTLVSAVLLHGGAGAAPGDLDPAFGNGGVAISDFSVPGDARFDSATAMVVQDDGKIVVAGLSDNAPALARYSTDGSLDPAFNSSGKVRFPLYGGATSVALQNDGKIVAAGPEYLMKLLPDGSADPGFSGDGRVVTSHPEYQFGIAVAVRPDRRILVAGRRAIYLYGAFNTQLYLYDGFAVACYLEDGTLDPAFGTGGRASVDLGRQARITAMTLDDQGRILLAGTSSEPSGNDLALVRLLPGGAIDPSFGGTGKVLTSLGYNDGSPNLAVLPDGRILAGFLADGNAALARFLPTGSPDPAFDGDGKVSTNVKLGEGSTPERVGLAVAADGKIIMGGTSRQNSLPRFTVARFLAGGSLDLSFNGTGVAMHPLGESGSSGEAAAFQVDGRILMAGTYGSDFAVARYLVEGPGARVKPPANYFWDSTAQFGSAYVRGTPTLRTFTLENQGTEPLGGLSIHFDGTAAADFSALPTLPESLAPGASLAFQVAFSPKAAGVRTANLRLLSNDPTRNPFTVALTGTGYTRPLIRVEMPDGTPIEKSNDNAGGLIDFGAVPVGVPVDLTLTIRNPGSADLTGLNASTLGLDPSQFTVVEQPVAPVAPDDSTTLTVRFVPSSHGGKTAPLRIPSNADSGFYIRMIGSGIAPSVAVADPGGIPIPNNTGSLNFGRLLAGQAVTRALTIRNAGSADLVLTSLVLEGDGASSFETGTLPEAPLPPGALAVIDITFRPAIGRKYAATLGFATNDPAQPQFHLGLVGQALAPILQVYDDRGFVASGTGTSTFDPVLPGESDEEQIWLANLGDTDLTGISVTIAGEHAENFSIIEAPPSVIGPWGQGAAITVRFSAAASGPRSAELRIQSNDLTTSLWVVQLSAGARESSTSGNGRLDPGFGPQEGGETFQPGVEGRYELLVQPDGKIVTLGTSSRPDGSDLLVARFMPDGTPDPSFGTNGQARIDTHEWEGALDMVRQADGRLVIAGDFYGIDGFEVVLIRLLPDGSLDPGFGEGGVVSSLAAGLGFQAEELALRPDGTILLAGHQYNGTWLTPMILGLLGDGTPDLGFGNAGVAVDPLTEWDGEIHAAARSDGAIFMTGWFDGEFRLVRFQPDGTLDVSFGNSGRLTGRIGESTGLSCVEIQADGLILLGGGTLMNGRYEDVVLRRLPDGSPDPDFGTAGVALLDFPNPANIVDLAVQPDGGVVVAGELYNDGITRIHLARLKPDGSIDRNFGDGGMAKGPAASNAVLAWALDGDLLMVSRVSRPMETGLGLYRFSMNLPSAGSFAVSPATDVMVGAPLSAGFAGWTSGSGPLAYQVLVDGIPVSPSTSNPDIGFTAPQEPGLHFIVGRITDSLGRSTEVTRPLRVIGSGAWWQALHFDSDPENGGDDEDPDGDGRSNLLEFATGSDPRSGANLAEGARVTGGAFVFTYHRSKSAVLEGLSFTVESSADPAGTWSPSIGNERVVDEGDHERVTTTLPAGTAGRMFARLRVERP